jgi:valyl-tRNA synthetase
MHGVSDPDPQLNPEELSIYAIEVLRRLDETIDAVDNAYRRYEFNTVAQRLYDFVWGDFCDWFVEAAKTEIFGTDEARKKSVLATMDYVISSILRLLHPFMPHITDELWLRLGFARTETDFLDFVPVPQRMNWDESVSPEARVRVRAIYETVQAGRNLRAEARVPSSQKIKFALRSDASWLQDERFTLERLLNADSIQIDPSFQQPAGSSVAATKLGELFLMIGETDRVAERERLNKEITKLEAELKATEAKLANSSFVQRAPTAVVEEHQRRREDFRTRLSQLRQAQASLG